MQKHRHSSLASHKTMAIRAKTGLNDDFVQICDYILLPETLLKLPAGSIPFGECSMLLLTQCRQEIKYLLISRINPRKVNPSSGSTRWYNWGRWQISTIQDILFSYCHDHGLSWVGNGGGFGVSTQRNGILLYCEHLDDNFYKTWQKRF